MALFRSYANYYFKKEKKKTNLHIFTAIFALICVHFSIEMLSVLGGSCFKYWDQDTTGLVFSVRENYDFAAWGSSWGAGWWWRTPSALAVWHDAQAGSWHGRDSSQLLSVGDQGASAVLLEQPRHTDKAEPARAPAGEPSAQRGKQMPLIRP